MFGYLQEAREAKAPQNEGDAGLVVRLHVLGVALWVLLDERNEIVLDEDEQAVLHLQELELRDAFELVHKQPVPRQQCASHFLIITKNRQARIKLKIWVGEMAGFRGNDTPMTSPKCSVTMSLARCALSIFVSPNFDLCLCARYSSHAIP